MKVETCGVCHGHQVIRLPMMSPIAPEIYSEVAAVAPVTGYVRTYPCPECAPVMPLEHFIVLSATIDIDQDWAGAEAKGADLAKGEAADVLAEELLKRGLIGTTEEASPRGALFRRLRAEVAVAPPGRRDAIRAGQERQRVALAKRIQDAVLDALPAGGSVNLGDLYKAFETAIAVIMREPPDTHSERDKRHSGVV